MFGVNFSSTVKNKPYTETMYQKRSEYYPFGNIATGDMINQLKSKNIKIVRQLLILDEVIDDDTDKLNKLYLAQFAEVSSKFLQNGFIVILDFHQDCFSRRLGGCGLPRKYHPQYLQEHFKHSKNGGRNWGATPIMSKKQQKCWEHFYNNCIQMYSDDILRISLQLKQNLKNQIFYQYLDIINEPGCEKIRNISFLFKFGSKQRQILTGFYEQVILKLFENFIGLKYIIEPYNYDVSQIAFNKYLGLNKLNKLSDSQLKQVVFGPHVYEPVFICDYEKTLKNHLHVQKQLKIDELMIGEFGDLTFGQNCTKLVQQIQLFQQLDLNIVIWELDPCYNSSCFKYEQDSYPWNMEQMSVLCGLNKVTKIGYNYFKFAEFQKNYYVIQIDYKLMDTIFNKLCGQQLRNVRLETRSIIYKYVFQLIDNQQLIQIRINCLQSETFIQVIEGFVFSDKIIYKNGIELIYCENNVILQYKE